MCSQFLYLPIMSCNFEGDDRKIDNEMKTVRPTENSWSHILISIHDIWASLMAWFDQ